MKLSLFVVILSVFTLTYAQNDMPQQRRGGSISGKVIEAGTQNPIEYANIILFKKSDSTQVTGTITDSRGLFNLSPVFPGSYYLNIQFIGYDKITYDDVNINRNNPNVNIGTIEFKTAAVNLDNVIVEGERNPISYQIDRKVIDVNQLAVSMSGTAADVLENVPSVTVDIDGNVSLRGSQNFTVLVDGRPSVLDAQDVLQQIPAGTIDNIEIITNPSAKYDPEGSSGILNIILKNQKASGFSGVTNLNAGLNNKYGGDVLFEYKTTDISTNIGIDYNNRFSPGEVNQERRTTYNGVTSYTLRDGDTERGRKMFGLRGGIEYWASENDILALTGRFGDREMHNSSFQNHYQWNDLNPVRNLLRNNSSGNRGGYFFALNLGYTRKFEGQGHQVISELSFRRNNSDEESKTELFEEGLLLNGRLSTESGPSSDVEAKIDYTLPFNQTSRFEAGYQGEIDISEENTGYYEAETSGIYAFFPQFSHRTKSDEREHAFYSTYSGETGDFGYQLGLRGENTFRTIKVDDFEDFKIDEWDFFPGVHTSYKFSEGKQIMASYTRRIQRPRGWSLEPFETWSDANNVRKGNPELKSENIDSYELGVSTYFGDLSLSLEGYYRMTHNKIEHLTSAYAPDVNLTTFDNIGSDYSLGSEMMVTFGFGSFWDVRLMGNIYNYKIKGVLFEEPFSRESFNWNTRVNNNLKFSTDTQLQVTFSYNSPSVSAQGSSEGFLTTDLAVKQDLLNKSLSLTLQIRDLFGTAKHSHTSSGPDFYNYSFFNRESPMVMFNVRFNINNYRIREDRRNEDNQPEFEEGEEF